MAGFGEKRLEGVRAALASRLRGRTYRPSEPSAADLLAVDREYRQLPDEGRLRTIRPRRHNPAGETWLRIMHARRSEHECTALFSNTARAHELGKTRDWVVVYNDHRDGREGQCTVITAQRSPVRGRRIVRGREAWSAHVGVNPLGLSLS
jgi:hypothetical protein